MFVKKKQAYLRKYRNPFSVKKETSSNFRVVYATKEEIEASASKILKSMQTLFGGYLNDRGLNFVKRYATHASLEHRRLFMKEKRKVNVREACKRYSKRVEAKRRKMESEADIDQMMLQIMQDAMPNSDVEIRPDGSMEITQE